MIGKIPTWWENSVLRNWNMIGKIPTLWENSVRGRKKVFRCMDPSYMRGFTFPFSLSVGSRAFKSLVPLRAILKWSWMRPLSRICTRSSIPSSPGSLGRAVSNCSAGKTSQAFGGNSILVAGRVLSLQNLLPYWALPVRSLADFLTWRFRGFLSPLPPFPGFS